VARHGPATVTDLANRLPVTRQAVAKHLTQLIEAGLLRADAADGRRVRFRVDPAPVRAALRWLTALATDWDDRCDQPMARRRCDCRAAGPVQPDAPPVKFQEARCSAGHRNDAVE
jgi:DNA-binding MarR family transcriptional regulator